MSCITVLSEKGKALKAKEDKAKDDLFDLGVKEKDNTSKKTTRQGWEKILAISTAVKGLRFRIYKDF